MTTNFPPSPYNPFPDLPLYQDAATGCYFYDDISIDYTTYRQKPVPVNRSRTLSGGVSKDDLSGPPSPGGGSEGSGSGGIAPHLVFNPPGSGFASCETYTNFWLNISSSSNLIQVTISNTLPGLSYLLLEKTNLTQSSWASTAPLTATGYSIAFDFTNNETAMFFAAVLTTNDLPPIITDAPTNQIIALGGTASFTVTATGLTNLNYQWQLNGVDVVNGGNIAGVTSDHLTITSVGTNNVGNYTILVSNTICTASAQAGLGLTWTNVLPNAINASPAIGPDGSVYIATTGNQLFAFDPSGITSWSNSVNTSAIGDITSSAGISADGSTVYIGSQDGYLYAFYTATGAVQWTCELGSGVAASPAIGTDGAIYITTEEGNSNGLFAVTPSGLLKWSFQTDNPNGEGDGINSSPAIGPDCSIYFLSLNNDLYAVSPEGRLKWFFPLPSGDDPDGSPAIDANGNILIGSHDGYVYCIDSAGNLVWLFDTADASPIQSSVAIGPNSEVYAASLDGNLYAITNGGLDWKLNPEGSSFQFLSSPAISEDGVVIIGSASGNVYGITNGFVKWTRSTAAVLSSPAIDPRTGAVVIADEDGNVYSFGGVSGVANGAWPMFRQNARHSGASPSSV